MRKYCYAFFLAAIFINAGPTDTRAQQTLHNLKVGAVLPLSGPMAPYGKEVLSGAKIALEFLQENEPALARRITIESADDQSLARQAEQAARQLFSSHRVDVLLGSLTSVTTLAISRVAQEARRPIVVPTATDARVTEQHSIAFRTSLSDQHQGEALARFAYENLNIRRIAILIEDASRYSRNIAQAFENKFKAIGGQIASSITYDAGNEDFSGQIRSIRQARAQAVIMPGYYPDAASFLSQAKEAALSVPVLGADGWDSPDLIELTGRLAIGGHFYLTHFSAGNPDEINRRFVQRFREEHQRDPSVLGAMGFDAMMVIIDAFRRANSNLAPALIRALNDTQQAAGLVGEITFDGARQAVKPAAIISTAASGVRFHSQVSP